MKDPYKVLGLDKSADPELLKSKYQELHDLYSEQRFRSGEEGNEGARKLQELEDAWAMINSDFERDTVNATFNGDYGVVDDLIRQGKYDEAQNMLDAIQNRNGEWHYMQAIIFYKREWLTDAKTQLEMALRDDPGNAKYRSSLDKLNITMGQPSGSNRQSQQHSNPYNGGQYSQQPPPQSYDQYNQAPQNDMSNCLSTCCCAYCLTDCLCNLMHCC